MNKRMKRLLAMMLSTVMITSSMSTVAFAQETTLDQQANEVVADSAITEEAAEEAARITINQKPNDGTSKDQPFAANTGGSANFRIPAMVTMNDGTIVAAADARWDHTADGYGLDTMVSRSTDKGANWKYTFANYLGDNGNQKNADSTAFIDPALAVKDNTIYMLVDLYPHGGFISQIEAGNGYDTNGRLELTKNGAKGYYLGAFEAGKAKVFNSQGREEVGYTVDEYFNITGNGVDTNLFFSDSPYQVLKTSYLYLTTSTDNGATWSAPKMLNSQVKNDNETFYGVGPGRGLVTSTGRIIFPCYRYVNSYNEKTSVIYSDDNGATWKRSNDMSAVSSEATLVEADGKLYMFTRHGGYYVSNNMGETWGAKMSVGLSYDTGCQISAITYSKKIDGKTAILLSAPSQSKRQNGKIYVGLVQADGLIQWRTKPYAVNTGAYSYSCLTELSDGSIGLLYEPESGKITYQNIAIENIAPGAQIEQPAPQPEPEQPQLQDETGATITAVTFANNEAGAKTFTVNGLAAGESVTAVSENSAVASVEANADKITVTPVSEGTTTVTATVVGTTKAVGDTVKLTVTVENKAYVPGISEVTKEAYTNYVLDTDGVDAGEDYLIVVPGENYALTNKGGATGASTDKTAVTVTGNEVTGVTNDTEILWRFDAVGTNYTIKNQSAYVWLNNSAVLSNKTAQPCQVTLNNGKYSIHGSNKNLSWYVWENRFSSYRSATPMHLYKKIVTLGGVYYKTDITPIVTQINIKKELEKNKELYTAESWAVLEQAIAAAEGLTSQEYPTLEEANVAQQQIIDKAHAIAAAIEQLEIRVIVGKTVTLNNVLGTLTNAGDTAIAQVVVDGTKNTMTIQGVTVGKTSVVVGNKTYRISVENAPTIVDSATTPLVGGVHHNQGCANDVVAQSKPITKLILSETLTFDVDLKTDYADATVTWEMENSNIATVTQEGIVTGKNIGTTNLIVTIDGVVYKMPVEIYEGVASTSEIVNHYDLYIENINHTKVYKAIMHGSKATASTELTEVQEGEVIYLEYRRTENFAIDFFGKPDAGYALTRMSAPNSKGDYMSIINDADPMQTEFYTTTSAAGYNQKGLFDIVTLINNAVKSGCHAGMGFTRKARDPKCCPFTLSFQSEKLPTVAKEVVSVDGNPYKDGMLAKPGQVVKFKVSVTQYAAEDRSKDKDGTYAGDIKYTNVTLIDKLTGATFERLGKASLDVKNLSDTIVDKDTTHEYFVDYTIKEEDLDKTIVNTVDLKYNYSSNYSTGTYNETASADAKFTAASFKPKDIVVDFGQPVVMDYNKEHGLYNLVDNATTTANAATVTVKDNVVTYTLNSVLTTMDTVTLRNTEGGEYKFNVYPATSVYYEEGFASYTGTWNSTNKGTRSQATEFVGEGQNIYGYDAVYKNNTGHSGGSVATSSTNGDTAEITFHGTGIDAYTLTTATSGNVSKWLYDANGKLVKFGFVDTHQDYLQDSNGKVEFYNTPTVTYNDLTPGTYRLKIKVESGNISLDGFRVYNTQGNAYDNVYTKDKEDGAVNVEVRNVAIAGAEFDETKLTENKHVVAGQIANSVYEATNNGNGAIVLSPEGQGLTIDIHTDMVNRGPKNEMYISPNETIAMKLTGAASKVAIGMRSLNGGVVSYKVNNTEATLNSTVDMYYEVTPNNGMIVIQNTGNTVLALSKIKATQFKAATGTTLAENITNDADTIAYALMCMSGELDKTMADATANIKLVDHAGNALATTALTANGEEGTDAHFTAADIKTAAEQIMPAGYAFAAENALTDETVVYGQNKDVLVQIGKVATLNVTYKSVFGKKVGTATLTAVQTSANKRHRFSAAEIKKAAPAGIWIATTTPVRVKYGTTKNRTVLGL